MLGAIAGDIIGSIYEFHPIKTADFPLFSPKCRFTDDTVLTVALADSILHGEKYGALMRQYYRDYPHAGYGSFFHAWARSEKSGPYKSFGNGAAMRISPAGFACESLDETLIKAKEYTEITHDHPEGIKGAQATAAAIFLARTGNSKKEIKTKIAAMFNYDLSRTLDEIRPGYGFDVTCQGTVPEALTAFLESNGFEDAVRKAVSLGGDSDTLACITGGIAHAFYGAVPENIAEKTFKILDRKLGKITKEFLERYLPG